MAHLIDCACARCACARRPKAKSPGMDHNCIGIGCRWAGCEGAVPMPPPPEFAPPHQWLTITLTNAPARRIDRAEWPILAEATERSSTPRPRNWTVRVRRHADGRAIVHGIVTTAGDRDARGGEFLGGDPLPSGGIAKPDSSMIAAAIRRVADSLDFPSEVANRCIAKLPAIKEGA